jgi:hypothetical protein
MVSSRDLITRWLQGSDNQVVIQSARSAGIDKVIMPYISPGFIYSTVRHKDRRRDLYSPKYVVRSGIKAFGAGLAGPEKPSGSFEFMSLEQFDQKVKDAFVDTVTEYFEDVKETSPIIERPG